MNDNWFANIIRVSIKVNKAMAFLSYVNILGISNAFSVLQSYISPSDIM